MLSYAVRIFVDRCRNFNCLDWPTVLITLVVIGIVGLIVYALKNNNETIQEPLTNRSDNKGSKPIATTTPAELKESFNRNIVTPIANDSFIEFNQNMIGNEDI